MNLIHLPTLDGSPEAACARLTAIEDVHLFHAILETVEDARSACNEVDNLVHHHMKHVDCAVTVPYLDALDDNLDLLGDLLAEAVAS